MTVIKSSQRLLEFYRLYLVWAMSGGFVEEAPHFSPGVGLCANLNGWADYNYGAFESGSLNNELRAQFRLAGLDEYYPFGRRSYHNRNLEHTQHLCRKRIAWIRQRIRDGAL